MDRHSGRRWNGHYPIGGPAKKRWLTKQRIIWSSDSHRESVHVTQVRKSVTIDWTLCESARAKIKVLVKRILKRHGYPPDLQEEATQTVLAQADFSAQNGRHK
jgi:Domain of unknown function (DUF3387)